MPSNINLFKEHLNSSFIETGSYKGDGISNALSAGFENVLSIELTEFHHKECYRKFNNDPRVKLYHGDSGSDLKILINEATKPITFWLDGHYSGGTTGGSDKDNPIIKELNQIREANLTKSIILIDDVGYLRDLKLLEEVKENLKLIDPNGTISQQNDILIFKQETVNA